jgi:DNA N-6-adenine-methyltransferase (Dam)
MTAGAMGAHQSARMLTDTWLTPPEILAALGPFDLDPCAAPDPRPWPTAARHIGRPDDGLAATWSADDRVWLNPPYGPQTGRWLGRLADHGRGTALVFARTETSWFAETVWGAASGALFLRGRIRFCRPDGRRSADNSGAPSVLLAYGEDDARRLAGAGLDGTFVRWERAARPLSLLDLEAS